MQLVARLAFFVVMFGQFGLGAAAFYLPVTNPSWPFWIALYGICTVLSIGYLASRRPVATPADVWFLLFMSGVIVSFLALGESDAAEFWQRTMLICIAPYFGGRIVGRLLPASLPTGLQIMSVLYLLLVSVEYVRNPAAFASDRLLLYAPPGDANGDPLGSVAFNLSITFGATWIVAFALLSYRALPGERPLVRRARLRMLAIVIGLPAVLLLIGSRTSVVSILSSAVILLACASWISTQKKLLWLIGAGAGLLIALQFVSEERQVMLDELPTALEAVQSYSSSFTICSMEQGSVLTRVVQLSEAFRLFFESPIVGVGASNFGLRYCEANVEFASPHSLFAHVLVEYGLVGAGLLAALLFSIVRKFLQQLRSTTFGSRPAAWVLFAVWLFVLIQEQFLGNLFYDYHIFLLTGVLVSVLYDDRHSVSRPVGAAHESTR
jgi:O-antigen ligase